MNAGIDAAGLGVEAVGFAIVSGGGFHGSAGGEEEGLGDAHGFLVAEELVVGSAGVVGVLVDVDDRAGRLGFLGIGIWDE